MIARLSLVAWLIIFWSSIALAAPTQPPPVDAKDQADFIAGLVSACVKGKRGRGVEERPAQAQCLCAAYEFRAALSQDELRQLVAGGMMNDDVLAKGLRARLACESVGTYDSTAAQPTETELSLPRRFERLSIRLPRGFVPVAPGKSHYSFMRLHADLETAAAISIRVVPIADLGLAGHSKSAAMATLMVAAIKSLSRNDTFVPSTVPDLNIGSMRLQGVEFKSSENGRDIRGYAYVTIENDEAIVVKIQDVLPHADVTLPLIHESLKTIVLDGNAR